MEKESGGRTPAYKTLRSAWHNGTLNLATRNRIRESAEAEFIAALDA
jgi:hypothetical protein